MNKYIYILSVLVFVIGCKNHSSSYQEKESRLQIIQKPIIWDNIRDSLSLDYMRIHHNMERAEPIIVPQMVVVHWTAIKTFEGSFRAFNSVLLPGREKLQKASPLNVSVQYLIDQDGKIYQLTPDNRFCRHVIGLNHCAIGIENVGNGSTHPLTEAQLESNIALIKQLKLKHNKIEYVIGHHEYRNFNGTPLYIETDTSYYTRKSDPGDDFMDRIHEGLNDRSFKRASDIK